MAVRSIECSACGMEVPYGRLSCPSCGELLASVAGVSRPLTWVAPDATPAAASPMVATPMVATPGAYVPPTPEPLAPAEPALPPPVIATPAGLPAPARAWAGMADIAEGDAAPAVVDARDTDSLERLLDPAHRGEAIGWVAVAGSTMAAVGFLLPWSTSVIGAAGVGYFDRWGFAGPGHPLVVIALLAVAALAVIPNPIAAWVRLGVPGLGLAALLVGLVWPYLFGPLGADPGALLSAVGALVLGASAIAALAHGRHAAGAPGV